ncbi:MAG: hypothetical protein Q8Q09_20225 [Deltaproteobacteria bacterium]|nr:hypothetical protein [Deltaproteobacteria bacterium]
MLLRTLYNLALVAQLLAAAMWLGSLMVSLRVGELMDASDEPLAQKALAKALARVQQWVCDPWRSLALGTSAVAALLAGARSGRPLWASGWLWVALFSVFALQGLHHALARRLRIIARTASLAGSTGYVSAAPQLRRLRRAVFVSAGVAAWSAIHLHS